MLRRRPAGPEHGWYDTAPAPAAGLQVGEGRLGTGEVDQHVEIIDYRANIRTDLDTQLADTGEVTGIAAQQRTLGMFKGDADLESVGIVAGIDQAAAHAAGSTGYCDFCHIYQAFLVW